MECEVIVVGAGPAGATAATALAQQGHEVLLLDRQSFPRPKSCGDGVPILAIEILDELGVGEKVRQAGFYPIHHIRLVSPGGHVLDTSQTGDKPGLYSYVAPRLDFDLLLQQYAIESGAEFRLAQVREPILQNGRVVGVRAQVDGRLEDIFARVVIGADGPTSVMARALRPRKQKDCHRAVALRAYIEDLELLPHTSEFHFNRDILPGYAWIFPLGGHRANIGLGIRLDKLRRAKLNLKQMLFDFLAVPAIKERLKEGGQLRDLATWQLNYGSQKRVQRAFDGAVLIGDAGALINPLTGGGIRNALLSAQLAAAVIHKGLKTGDLSRRNLQTYEQGCHKALWSNMRFSYLVQRLILFPRLADLIVKQARSNRLFARTIVPK